MGRACSDATFLPFATDQLKINSLTFSKLLAFYFYVLWLLSFLDFISIVCVPMLKGKISCFGKINCYPASFAYCLLTAALAFVVLLCGNKQFVKVKPVKTTVKAPLVILYAVWSKLRSKKGQKEKHWLDYAKKKFDEAYVEEVKQTIKVITYQMLIVWTLLHQRYTMWTVLATRVSRTIGNTEIAPEQVQAIYPFFNIVFVPLYYFYGRPLLTRVIKGPLMQMVLAGILVTLAFLCSTILSFCTERDEVSSLPSDYNRITFINGRDCTLEIKSDFHPSISIAPYSFQNFNVEKKQLQRNSTFLYKCFDEKWSENDLNTNKDDESYYILYNNDNQFKHLVDLRKLRSSLNEGVLLYCICDSHDVGESLVLKSQTAQTADASVAVSVCSEELGPEISLSPGKIKGLSIDESNEQSFRVDYGDVIILYLHNSTIDVLKVLPSLNISVWWMIPQYLLLSASSVIFTLAVFIYTYNETPLSSTALVWSFKHFNIGLDSITFATSSFFIGLSLSHLLWTCVITLYVLYFWFRSRNYKYTIPISVNATAR